MVGILALLSALAVSLIVSRIAAMALMFTGLSHETARFQARSAFSGVGYTTSEAESIVNHPVRRRIVMMLMLLGNIGIATVIATVMLSFSGIKDASWWYYMQMIGVLIVGLILLALLFSSRWVERQMNKVIAWSLRQFTDLNVRDYVSLLHLSDGYTVSEFVVESKHWIAGGVLRQMRLADEGVLVLGIHHADGTYKGIPRAEDTISAGDTLILYGNIENIRELDRRRPGQTGDKDHLASVKKQADSEVADA